MNAGRRYEPGIKVIIPQPSEKFINILQKIFSNEKIETMKERIEREKEAINLRNTLLELKFKLEKIDNEIERLNAEILIAQSANKELPVAVREIINLGIKGVYGTIYDLMRVSEEFETAIIVAAANHLYDIVVEDFETAKFCIEYLKREKIGRATFIPLDKIKPKRLDEKYLDLPGVVGIASDLIKYDKKFEPAFQFVFGNTLVIENLEVAKNIGIGKVRMVTLDGDLIERSGLVTGGFYEKKAIKLISSETETKMKKIKELNSEREKILEMIKEIEEKLKQFEKKEEKIEIKYLSEEEIEKLRKERKKLYEKKAEIQNKLSSIRMKLVRIDLEIESLNEQLKEYENIKTIDKNLEQLEIEYEETKEKLKNIGYVNFKAEEEYNKIKPIYDEIYKKYQIINQEKQKILEFINEIEKKKRETFMKTFEIVNQNFSFLFSKLFGGEAKLELYDAENIDQAKLIIKARFPNKPFLSIDALSGGEKTLVALTFLFSLQKAKAPFFVLDEVDMMLDKENSEKIAKAIKELSKETQIILISHNDITIKYADALFGVTMVNGESKVLSIDLNEALKYASS